MIKEKRRMLLDRVLILLGVAVILVSIVPLFFHIKHVGVWVPLTGGALLAGYGLLHSRVALLGSGSQIIDRIVLAAAAAAAVCFFIMSAIMLFGFQRYHGNYQDQTVIVLGCKIREDRPTNMLRYRLDKAYEILSENPESSCVVSGGQGDDEDYPESQVMKQYLVTRGIDPERIFEENQSVNTKENIYFSKDVIDAQNLSPDMIIVTDFYHEYRANYYAKQAGLSSVGEECFTNPGLVFSYWVREMFGVVKAWVID